MLNLLPVELIENILRFLLDSDRCSFALVDKRSASVVKNIRRVLSGTEQEIQNSLDALPPFVRSVMLNGRGTFALNAIIDVVAITEGVSVRAVEIREVIVPDSMSSVSGVEKVTLRPCKNFCPSIRFANISVLDLTRSRSKSKLTGEVGCVILNSFTKLKNIKNLSTRTFIHQASSDRTSDVIAFSPSTEFAHVDEAEKIIASANLRILSVTKGVIFCPENVPPIVILGPEAVLLTPPHLEPSTVIRVDNARDEFENRRALFAT